MSFCSYGLVPFRIFSSLFETFKKTLSKSLQRTSVRKESSDFSEKSDVSRTKSGHSVLHKTQLGRASLSSRDTDLHGVFNLYTTRFVEQAMSTTLSPSLSDAQYYAHLCNVIYQSQLNMASSTAQIFVPKPPYLTTATFHCSAICEPGTEEAYEMVLNNLVMVPNLSLPLEQAKDFKITPVVSDGLHGNIELASGCVGGVMTAGGEFQMKLAWRDKSKNGLGKELFQGIVSFDVRYDQAAVGLQHRAGDRYRFAFWGIRG